MPAKKKEEKRNEEEEVVEETGTYVFGDDTARYSGTVVRRDGFCRRHGKGTYKDGSIQYVGDWVNDVMQGIGTLTFLTSGSVYAGSFLDGKFDGAGIFRWADGSYYEGHWRFNHMHGEGKYVDVTGKAWHGHFYNGTGPGLRPSIAMM